MLDKNDYNELLSLEASCIVLLEQCRKLRLKAEGEFSPSKRKKKGLSEEQRARLLATREKWFLKQSKHETSSPSV